MSNRRIILCAGVLLILQIIGAFALWRYWELNESVRAATESGNLFRHTGRISFIFTVFPLLTIFEYLVVKALITKEGMIARLIFSLYVKS